MNCAWSAPGRLLCSLALAALVGCGRAPLASQGPPSAAAKNAPARLLVVPCSAITESDGPNLSASEAGSPGNSDRESAPAVFKLQEVDLARQRSATQNQQPAEPKSAASETADTTESSVPLPWGPSTPSTEMTAVALRAEQAARRGFNLAERAALYSARAQFIESLRIIAQALDEQRGTTAHTKALSAGLRAMEEVSDLVPRDNRLETDLNLKLIVDAHHTPVLKDRPLDEIAVADAQRMYLTYAQEQLAAAAGDQAVASLALHGLGKICVAPAEMHGPREQIAEAKAVTFYQAALVVEPQNFMAANELGVLLTRYGRLKDAKAVFEQSVTVSDAPTSWRNLAVVCDRLGDATKAADARHEADAAVARLQKSGYATAGMRYPIEWVSPEKFANSNSMVTAATSPTTSVMSSPAPHPATASAAQSSDQQSTTAAKTTNSSIWPWIRK